MKYGIVIFGMMAVTYLPRLIPLFLLAGRTVPPLVKRFLLYIPYAALSALILHGILEAEPGMAAATLAGVIIAGAASWFKGGLVVSVLLSIIAAYLIQIL